MEATDLTVGGRRAHATRADAEEVVRLQAAFNRMLDRLETDRREAARGVLRAQEQERPRLAQDLHDEGKQALTAILLPPQAAPPEGPPALRPGLETPQRLAPPAL